jgi:hypothetical protein
VAFELVHELAVDGPEPHAEHLQKPVSKSAVLTEKLLERRATYGTDDALVDSRDARGARPSIDELEFSEEISRVEESEERLVPQPVPFGDPDASACDQKERVPFGLVLKDDLPRREPAFSQLDAQRCELLVGEYFGQNVVAKPFEAL